MRDEFYFPSKDGNTEIHTIEWKPDKEVKAVLQLCHGMVEYIGRYDEFAQFLCDKGYYVVGNDISDTENPYRQSPSTDFSMKNMEMYVCSEIFIRSGSAQRRNIRTCLTLCWDTVWGPLF